MAQITTKQHSYSDALALLNVEATAIRADAETVSITAKWNIYTAESYCTGAPRYLVLFVGSASGTKYYSTVIGSDWEKETNYNGTYTFTGIPLPEEETTITIGFGVSGSNTSLSASGTIIWNGSSVVSSSYYDPDIQLNQIWGIVNGYTPCTAPTVFTASPELFEDFIRLEWDGATAGSNNPIAFYSIECATSDDGDSWEDWISYGIESSSPAIVYPGADFKRGAYIKFRIQAIGEAGPDYYSELKESNIVKKAEPKAYICKGGTAVPHGVFIHKGTGYVRHYPYKYDGEKWVPCSE